MKNKLINKLKKLFKNGFFHVLTGNILTNLIAFISSVVVVRIISKVEYAHLTYANNLYAYVILLSGLGLSTALLKFCSPIVKKEYDKAYLYFALLYGVLIQFIFSFVVIIYLYIGDSPFPKANWIVWALFLTPILNYVFQTLQNYTRAHGNNKQYARMGALYAFLTLMFSIVLGLEFKTPGIIIARYIALAIILIYAVKITLASLKKVRIAKLSLEHKKVFMVMGISLAVGGFFSSIIPMNELFLVNQLVRDAVTTANYKVAILIPSQLGIVTNAILVYFFPVIASMNDNKKIWNLCKKIFLASTAILSVICLIGFVVTPIIITYVYGSSYKSSITLMNIFWIVYFIHAAFRMTAINILAALGRVKFTMILAIISALAHLILDYIFINIYGIEGVAYATTIVYIISGIIYWIYLKNLTTNKESANNIPFQEQTNEI